MDGEAKAVVAGKAKTLEASSDTGLSRPPESKCDGRGEHSGAPNVMEPCLCETGRLLQSGPVSIKEATTGYLDAGTGQSMGSFVTYVIELNGETTRRRYSDFELLSAYLNRIYPYSIIPPIPDKPTITDIITSSISGGGIGASKHDPGLIQRRIRLFQAFLQRVAAHPALGTDHVVHRFVSAAETAGGWADPITKIESRLPECIKAAGGSHQDGPSSLGRKPKIPDPLFAQLENMTRDYQGAIELIESGLRTVIKALKDESKGLSDIGEAFNAFSLEYPTGALPRTLERIGECADGEVVELHALIRKEEEHLDVLRELHLYTACIERSLVNYTGKRIDMEDFHDTLNARKNALLQLETRYNESGSADNEISKTKAAIDQLEAAKAARQSEMSQFTRLLLADVGEVFNYFGTKMRDCLQALAEANVKWHQDSDTIWNATCHVASQRVAQLLVMKVSVCALFCIMCAFFPAKSSDAGESELECLDLADVLSAESVDFIYPVPVETRSIGINTEPMSDYGWRHEHPYAEVAAYTLVGILAVGIMAGVCVVTFMGHYKPQHDLDVVHDDSLLCQ